MNKTNETLNRISHILLNTNFSNIKRFDIKYGLMGHLLFFYSYDKFQGHNKLNEAILEGLDYALNRIQESNIDGRPFEQLADFGLFCELLKKDSLYNKLLNIDLTSIDAFISDQTELAFERADIDIIDGLLCGGYYFLRRTGNSFEKKLEQIVQYIYDIAKKDKQGFHWICTGMFISEKRVYLGLTHGVVSILAFILLCQRRGIMLPLCKEILMQGYTFLMNHRIQEEGKGFFPVLANYPSSTNRVEWCYGDLGIGYILNFIEKEFLKDSPQAYHVFSQDIMENCLNNNNLNNETRDFSIAHGFSGVAIIYRLYYQNTGLTAYNEKSKLITENILSAVRLEDEYLGISPVFKPIEDQHLNNLSFVLGLSGVGLNIISHEKPDIIDYKNFLYLL